MRLIISRLVVAANAAAMVYVVILACRYYRGRIMTRTGEIKFYPGVGPVIIPIPIANTKRGDSTWSGGSRQSAQKTKDR
jgi:hypothetical protein